MCLLAVALEAHPTFSAILCHNRDESLTRPTGSCRLEKESGLLCARDLRAGGTWMGLNTMCGFFVALTNVKPPWWRVVGDWIWRRSYSSRGELVNAILQEANVPSVSDRTYQPCHLVYGDLFEEHPSLRHICTIARPERGVEHWSGPGVFALSNGSPKEPEWDKVRRIKELITTDLASAQTIMDPRDLRDRLALSMLDDTPIHGSSIFVSYPRWQWQTREQTIVLVGHNTIHYFFRNTCNHQDLGEWQEFVVKKTRPPPPSPPPPAPTEAI